MRQHYEQWIAHFSGEKARCTFAGYVVTDIVSFIIHRCLSLVLDEIVILKNPLFMDKWRKELHIMRNFVNSGYHGEMYSIRWEREIAWGTTRKEKERSKTNVVIIWGRRKYLTKFQSTFVAIKASHETFKRNPQSIDLSGDVIVIWDGKIMKFFDKQLCQHEI